MDWGNCAIFVCRYKRDMNDNPNVMKKKSYETPDSEEIKVRVENNILSGGTVIGPGDEEPED